MSARWLAALTALAVLVLIGLAQPRTPTAAQSEADLDDPALIDAGRALYLAGCAVCHGEEGRGVGEWPAIVNSGAASADFQLRTGRMPFAGELGEQAQRKPPAYDEEEIRALVAYVASLGEGPDIPEVDTDVALLSDGQRLFASNCAPCHGANASGGALGGGVIAWPLDRSPPRIVAEAMILGPGQMPVFAWPQEEINAVATYVEYLRTAPDPGGFAIGGIGPVPEGFVAWFVGITLLVAIVYLIGREWDRKGDVE